MRVTQSMLSNNMLRNLGNSYNRLGTLQEQINTQKEFTKPSDDPAAAMMGMGYRTDVNEISQYTRNIGEATNWVESTDSAISQAVSVMQRIRELTVQASNDTYESTQRQNIATEITELQKHLVDIGDTEVGGKYIFNGQNTNIKPSENVGVPVDADIMVEIFSGISIPINTNGSKIFGTANDQINELLGKIKSDDVTQISAMLDGIDESINLLLTTQAQVGAKQNRIELMEGRLSQQEAFAKKLLSNNEDIDIEQAIIELTTQESIHSAALSVGSRVIQPSLVDFLR